MMITQNLNSLFHLVVTIEPLQLDMQNLVWWQIINTYVFKVTDVVTVGYFEVMYDNSRFRKSSYSLHHKICRQLHYLWAHISSVSD